MNVSTGDAVVSTDRLKKRDEIMNNKYLNAWQKKHLLDELDAAESKPAAKAPLQPPKQPDTRDKPKTVRPANPFTYLNGPTGPGNGKSPETAAGGSGGGGTPPATPGPSKPPAPIQAPAPPAVTKPEPPPRPDATPAPDAGQPKAGKPAENPKPSSPQVNPYESRKQSILNDKSLNIHQKRYLLDELEAKYGNGSDASPAPAPTVTVPYGLNGGDRQKAQDIAANDSMPDSQKKALMAHYEQKAKETLKYSRYNQLLQEIMNNDSLPPDQKKRQAGELKDRYYPGPLAWRGIELGRSDMFFLADKAVAELPEEQRALLVLKMQKDGRVTGEELKDLGIDTGREDPDYYAAYLSLAYKSAQIGLTYGEVENEYIQEKTGQGIATAFARWGTIEPEEGLFGRTPKGKISTPGAGRPAERPVGGAGNSRVLWSGGKNAMDVAADFAAKNGLKTLEQTATGKLLTTCQNIANKIFGEEKAYQLLSPLWDKASARFVRGADGVIHAFLNSKGISDTSVFMRIEYEIAKERGLKIIFHLVK